jgi:hypothetical protein
MKIIREVNEYAEFFLKVKHLKCKVFAKLATRAQMYILYLDSICIVCLCQIEEPANW